jgi:hypothetical protein
MHVSGINELTTVLTNLPSTPLTGAPTPSPDTITRFQDLRTDAGLVQAVGDGQTRQACTNDDNARVVTSGRGRWARGLRVACGSGRNQQPGAGCRRGPKKRSA